MRRPKIYDAATIASPTAEIIPAIWASCCSPSAVHDFGELADAPYLVMEYCKGVNLEAWVQARGGAPLDFDSAWSIIDLIAAGAAALHQAGVVHHDIKPTNVLVSDRFEVAIADLGLARREDASDAMNGGTPGFVAHSVPTRRSRDRRVGARRRHAPEKRKADREGRIVAIGQHLWRAAPMPAGGSSAMLDPS